MNRVSFLVAKARVATCPKERAMYMWLARETKAIANSREC